MDLDPNDFHFICDAGDCDWVPPDEGVMGDLADHFEKEHPGVDPIMEIVPQCPRCGSMKMRGNRNPEAPEYRCLNCRAVLQQEGS